MDEAITQQTVNAQRQRRYRERQREGVPSDIVFSAELTKVLFVSITNDSLRPVDAVRQVRSRLLKRG